MRGLLIVGMVFLVVMVMLRARQAQQVQPAGVQQPVPKGGLVAAVAGVASRVGSSVGAGVKGAAQAGVSATEWGVGTVGGIGGTILGSASRGFGLW